MTAVKAPATVLVTGASGFIAVWVVKTFLEAGYIVRGTVRSASKGEYLVNLFKSYADAFQYVIVEDIAKEGAFDEAVKGVDAIAHTASPFHFQADDPQTLIDPAVKGTVGILASAQKYAPNVKRIVITSSVAAIMDGSKPSGTVFTENDWNTFSLREVETKGKAAAGGDKYRASKTLAEKAAWAFLEESKPNYDIATINPPMVFGPILQQVSDPESLNTSVAMLYKVLHTKESDLTKETLLTTNMNFVDVRDVALAHVRALEIPEAGGQRFITSGGTLCWQDALDVLPPPHPRGTPGSGKGLVHSRYDASKATRVLGINFKGLEETRLYAPQLRANQAFILDFSTLAYEIVMGDLSGGICVRVARDGGKTSYKLRRRASAAIKMEATLLTDEPKNIPENIAPPSIGLIWEFSLGRM